MLTTKGIKTQGKMQNRTTNIERYKWEYHFNHSHKMGILIKTALFSVIMRQHFPSTFKINDTYFKILWTH